VVRRRERLAEESTGADGAPSDDDVRKDGEAGS
jgi:hypothetical protein